MDEHAQHQEADFIDDDMDSLSKGSIGSNFNPDMRENTNKKYVSKISLMNYKTLATKKDNFMTPRGGKSLEP